jgi:hypothetical protein
MLDHVIRRAARRLALASCALFATAAAAQARFAARYDMQIDALERPATSTATATPTSWSARTNPAGAAAPANA